MATREASCLTAQPTRRDETGVVLQVFLEQRMVGRDHRHAERARGLEPCIVGDERGLDMDQIAIAGRLQHRAVHRPPTD